MGRPRRSTAESFYDVFADFTLEDQAAALKILEQIHRLAVRGSRRPAAVLCSSTALFADDKRVEAIADLGEPGRNAALRMDGSNDGGPTQ